MGICWAGRYERSLIKLELQEVGGKWKGRERYVLVDITGKI